VWLSLHQSPYLQSPLAVSQDLLISFRESQKATVRIRTSLLSMKMQFETPLSGLKPQVLRSLRTAKRGSIIISRRTACMDFRTRPRMVSQSRSQTVIRATCRDSHAALSVTGRTQTVTWMSPCAIAHVPVKQAVISPSALNLMYPAERIPDYSREQFIDDLLSEHETEIRRCLKKGAHKVQVDFTEGRLAVKIDPSGHLLNSFIDLNNLALPRFSPNERSRIGVHTCPGSDFDSTHSADVDYAELPPSLFELKAGNFYIALTGERDRRHVLKIIRRYLKPHQRVFVGVIAPINPHIETPEEVRDRSSPTRIGAGVTCPG
jgi:hypothetical protein